jgi:hypothetical protein
MKNTLFLLFLGIIGLFFLISSLIIIGLESLYWDCVTYLVITSHHVGLSLYDIYVIVFVILIPFTVIQCILYLIIRFIKYKFF